MQRRLAEESILFISIIKWVVLATGLGALIGVVVTWFLKALAWGIAGAQNHPYAFLLLPAALFLSARWSSTSPPTPRGTGPRRSSRPSTSMAPGSSPRWSRSSWRRPHHPGAGGSAGKEGPCAQIGAGIASMLAGFLKFSEHDRRKLVICGISAGFALVFGTPIAGSIFGVEVLFVGDILYEVLLPSFIAGITAYHVSSALGIHYFYHPVKVVPVFTEGFFLQVIAAGVFFGLCSMLLIETMKLGAKLSARLRIWEPLKGPRAAAPWCCWPCSCSTRYLGLGLETVEACLNGTHVPWYAFLLKPVFTSITLNFGGSGGIVTPIFFVGASSGTALRFRPGAEHGDLRRHRHGRGPGRFRQHAHRGEHPRHGIVRPGPSRPMPPWPASSAS